MRTPRPDAPPRRSISTLIGNGWLSEAPKNFWPRGWDIKSRSALRKCVFLPIPPEAAAFIKSLPPPKPFAAVPLSAHGGVLNRPATPPFRRHDPKKDARMFPLVSAEDVHAQRRRQLYAEAQRAAIGHARPSVRSISDSLAPGEPRRWYEDPVALGTLLIMVPPIGLAALWTSRRYSNEARWALTVMTGLTMCLAAAVVVAVMALQLR